MNTKIPNIEVIRSLLRRVKKDIKVRDLQPLKDLGVADCIADCVWLDAYTFI